MKVRVLRGPAPAALLLALGTSCGGGADAGGEVLRLQVDTGAAPRIAPSRLEEIANPRILRETPHVGRRIYEIHHPDGRVLAYRERVAVGPGGAFAVEPLEPLSGVEPDWPTFFLLQSHREGFVFRYRDFAIRDLDAFRRHWVLVDLGVQDDVAGVACTKFEARRRNGAGTHYEVWVDTRGLVLAYRELDPDGNLVSRMVYETFHDEPGPATLGLVGWHQPGVDELPLDPDQSLGDQIPGLAGTPVLSPRLIPDGYELHEAALLTETTNGKRWVKLTYTDGVEPLFFLADLPPGSLGIQGDDASQEPRPVVDSAGQVIVASVGRATCVQGFLAGRRLMAVGKVSEDELLDLVESALP